MATYTKPYRVVYAPDGRIICLIRGNVPQTHTLELCAQFDTEVELDVFVTANGLWLTGETE